MHLKRKYDKLVRLFNKDKQEAALKRKNKGKLVFIKIDLKKNLLNSYLTIKLILFLKLKSTI